MIANKWDYLKLAPQHFPHDVGEYDFLADPQPKERVNKFNRTMPKTRNYERVIAECAREQAPEIIPAGALGIEVLFFAQRKAGDLTNCLKSLEDALNRIAYVDDKQIDWINSRRIYGTEFSDRTLVRVWEAA